MRVVPLLIAAVLLGIAAAGSAPHNMQVAQQLQAISSKAGKTLSHIGKFEARHVALGKKIVNAERAFQAKQSTSTSASTCDQSAFADATAKVLQSCPSLSGLISGTTTLADFLPGFCGSECYNTLASVLPPLTGCLTSDTYFLAVLIKGCQTTPECYSEDFVGTNAKIATDCGDVSQVVNFANITTASETTVATLCSSGCVSRQTALMRKYPECIIDPTTGSALPATAIAGLMDAACQQDGGTYCAVKLKSLGKIDCQDNCNNANAWCTNCQLNVNTDKLNTLCSSCTTGLVQNLAAVAGEATTLAASIDLMCSTANGGAVSTTNPYCYPLAMAAYVGFESLPSRTIPSNATVASLCSGMTALCTDRVVGAAAAVAVATAQSTFVGCVSTTTYRSACVTNLEASLRTAETMRVSGNALCAQNAAGDFCMWRIASLSYDLAVGSCTAVASDVTGAGCCMPLWNDFARMTSSYYPATYLPPGARTVTYNTTSMYSYTHTAMYAYPALNRAQQPANQVVSMCSAVANTSAYWNVVESDCPAMLASPPMRTVPVMLAWSRVVADPALRANIEASLRLDTASAMGIPARRVLNGSLAENTAVSIQLRSDTRRASSSTGSACSYVFSVDAASAADASAAAARLDTAVAAGTFVTPATAAAVASQCTGCLDARATSLARASVDLNTTPAPTSAAPKISAFAAAIAAIAVAALL